MPEATGRQLDSLAELPEEELLGLLNEAIEKERQQHRGILRYLLAPDLKGEFRKGNWKKLYDSLREARIVYTRDKEGD